LNSHASILNIGVKQEFLNTRFSCAKCAPSANLTIACVSMLLESASLLIGLSSYTNHCHAGFTSDDGLCRERRTLPSP
jgi:hypothetical protein